MRRHETYHVEIRGGIHESYSIKELRKSFSDKHLFEFLEVEGFLYLNKYNEKSRRFGKVYPLEYPSIRIEWDGVLESADKNGDYGN